MGNPTSKNDTVDIDRLLAGLDELSKAFIGGVQGRYGMRVPAEPYRDGDLVCSGAGALIERLRAALHDLHGQVERFCGEQGEWEFYTGPALAALGRSNHEVHERDLQKLLSGDSSAPHDEHCDVNDPIIKGKPCNCRNRIPGLPDETSVPQIGWSREQIVIGLLRAHGPVSKELEHEAANIIQDLLSKCSAVETGMPPESITWLTRGKPDFAHWRKDSKVPYSWCDCVSCSDARNAKKTPANHNPFHAMERRLEAAIQSPSPVETPTPLAAGCYRSHPHEDMSPECERLTDIARERNQAAQNGKGD